MTDLVNTTGGMPETMTSLQMAELVDKRHDNVKRTVETLADQGVIARPQIEDVPEKSTNGRTYTTQVYKVGERDSYVIVAQLSPEFTARLVDFWQQHRNQRPAIDVRDPSQLAAIAIQLIEVNKELTCRAEDAEAKVAASVPKTAFYDQFANADGLYTLQNAGRIISGRPNKFIQELKREHLFYQGGSLVPRVQYRQAGLFEVKVDIIDEKARPQTFVTPKGLQHFAKKFGDGFHGGVQ